MLRAFLTIGALQGLVMGISLARTKGLAVLLGPSDYGIMGVIDPMLLLVGAFALASMNMGAVRFLPPLWRDDKGQFAALFRAMRNVVLVLVTLAALGGSLVAWQFPELFPEKLQDHAYVLPFAFLCVPILVLLQFLRNAIAARMQHNESMLFLLGHAVLFTGAAVIGVWWSGLVGYYILYAIGGTVFMAGTLYWFQRKPHLPRVKLENPWRLGLPRIVWGLCGAFIIITVVMAASDVFLRVELLDARNAHTAGLLVSVLGLSMAVREIIGAANQVLVMPNVNKGGDLEERVFWALQYQKVLCLAGLVLATPLLLFPDLVLRILYTAEFTPAAPFLCLFLVSEVLLLLSQSFGTLIVSYDNYRFHVIHTAIGYAFRVLLALLLIGPYGLLGAAFAQLGTPIVILVLAVAWLVRMHGMHVPARNVLIATYTVIGMLLLGWLGGRATTLDVPTISAKLGAAAAVAAGMYGLLDGNDRGLLRAAVTRLRRRPGETEA